MTGSQQPPIFKRKTAINELAMRKRSGGWNQGTLQHRFDLVDLEFGMNLQRSEKTQPLLLGKDLVCSGQPDLLSHIISGSRRALLVSLGLVIANNSKQTLTSPPPDSGNNERTPQLRVQRSLSPVKNWKLLSINHLEWGHTCS